MKKRKDTVRCIVLALTEDYELFDLQGKESQEEARGEFVSSFQRVSLPLRCYSNCKLSQSAVQRRQHNLSELRKIHKFDGRLCLMSSAGTDGEMVWGIVHIAHAFLYFDKLQ